MASSPRPPSMVDTAASMCAASGMPFDAATRAFRQAYILSVLNHHKGNVSAAARALGIHRNTVHKALRADARGTRRKRRPEAP